MNQLPAQQTYKAKVKTKNKNERNVQKKISTHHVVEIVDCVVASYTQCAGVEIHPHKHNYHVQKVNQLTCVTAIIEIHFTETSACIAQHSTAHTDRDLMYSGLRSLYTHSLI